MELNLPVSIRLGRKSYQLNLNFYRNAHYQILNKMKVVFSEQIQDQLDHLPQYESITLTYTLYPKTHRLCDVSNVCTIVDKFFCDALVRADKLEDDNYTFLKEIHYKFGEVDKDNPRVMVNITGKIKNANYTHSG